jgi:hypothetical protein
LSSVPPTARPPRLGQRTDATVRKGSASRAAMSRRNGDMCAACRSAQERSTPFSRGRTARCPLVDGVRSTFFFAPFPMKKIDLSRQARDKHMEPWRKGGAFFAGPEVCIPMAGGEQEYSVCDGVCAMQLSQEGDSSSGTRVTTRCVEVSTQDCDCWGGSWCHTAQVCTCETCTETWLGER